MNFRLQNIIMLIQIIENIKFLLFVLLLSSCGVNQGVAQETEGSKKAKEAFARADEHRVFGRYEEAMEAYREAVDIDPNFLKAHQELAQLYQKLYLDYEQAAIHYEYVVALDQQLPMQYYEGAKCYLYLQNWAKALQFAMEFDAKRIKSDYTDWQAQQLIESISFAREAVEHPLDYNPINLGPSVNTELAEYFPSITADNEFIYFTVSDPKDRYPNEDIFFAQWIEDEWQERVSVSGVNRMNAQEGAHSITQDGKYLFFASDRMDNNAGKFDIYIAKKVGEEWRDPVNMGPVINSRYWESQPVISADSKKLFFVRASKDGFGGSDIYLSEINENGSFGEPQNLGATINTPGDEQRPYLHPDGKTLYFASNGHPGFGKADLFKSTLQADGTWSKPINLGYPINTSEVEFGLYVAADGKRAFISSDREGGYGGMDIYSFELPSTAQPSSVVSVKGWVYDAQTEKAVKANIKIIEIESQKVYKTLSSDELNGSYLVVLPTGKNYAYHVNAEGYLPYSASFSLKDIKLSELVELKSPLTPIEKGAGFVLENIFFDSGDAQLQEESKAELDLLVNYLKDLPDMILEVGGHTDSDGTEESNVILSEDRAKAVYAYLVSRGVNESRLRYKGYGETQPLVPNDSESNKEKNRRTAFKVL